MQHTHEKPRSNLKYPITPVPPPQATQTPQQGKQRCEQATHLPAWQRSKNISVARRTPCHAVPRRFRHIWATPHHNHQKKLRRLLRTNRQRTGAKSISRWTRTLERLAAVVPQHTSATSNLLPEGRVAEEASLGAARGKAGWQSQRAAKNGDQNFQAVTPHPPHADTHNHPSALSGNPLAATPNKVRGGVWRDCAFLLHTTAARAAIAVAHASLARLLRLLFTRTSAAAWHRGERGRGEEGSGSPQVGSDPPGTLSWACCGLCRRSSLGSSRGSLSAPGTNWACTWPASTCW